MTAPENYFFTKKIRWLLWGLAGVVFALLVFHAGFVFGSHRLDPRGFMPPKSFITGGHGAVGEITSVTLPTLTLQEPDGDLEAVALSTSTVVREEGRTLTAAALTAGQHVLILGMPGSGSEASERINAELIDIRP